MDYDTPKWASEVCVQLGGGEVKMIARIKVLER